MIVPDTGSAYGGKHSANCHRSGAARQGGGQAGQAGVDARGGIHLGYFRPSGRDRRHAVDGDGRSPRGNSTTTTPVVRRPPAVRHSLPSE